MKEIIKYLSDRGREFDTADEATRDDKIELFETYVENSFGFDSRGMSECDFVQWFLDNRKEVLEFLK